VVGAAVAIVVGATAASTGAQVLVPEEAQMAAEVPTNMTIMVPVEAQEHR
jgi:hypothetical protein